MNNFSDYIIYADESGDHSLASINPQNPVFTLAFCIFQKSDYIDTVVPAFQSLKFDFWGHDAVVLHSHDIRKAHGDFNILLNSRTRIRFLARLNDLIEMLPVTVIAASIDKTRHINRYEQPQNPYEIALKFCLEMLIFWLKEHDQQIGVSHLIVEKRGSFEDRNLKRAFELMTEKSQVRGDNPKIELRFMDKKHNSTGLQIADLFAHPISRYVIDPDQENRAFSLLKPKLCSNAEGTFLGYGLKIFP